MRTRRLSLVLALAFLAALLVVVPVQAGRKVTEFLAYTNSWQEDPIERPTGAALHYYNHTSEIIHATDLRIEGTLTTQWKCSALWEHKLSVPGEVYWGQCNTTWRVEVTDSDGWEGVGHWYPQADFRVLMMKYTGTGYGQFKGMKVELTMSLDFYQEPYFITGRITEGG